MRKAETQRRLRGNGTSFADAEWRVVRTALTREAAAGTPSPAELCAEDGDGVVRALSGNGLCSWALHACPSLAAVTDQVRTALEQAAQYEIAACAQRKVALGQLDDLAAEHDCRMVVIKGAATSLVYYEKESFRPSADIDVLVPLDRIDMWRPEELSREPPPRGVRRHLPGYPLAGFLVERHTH